MRGKFNFTIQSWYPHMMPADIHLWEKFVRANAGFFTSCDYDVPVGEPPSWLDVANEELARKEAILYLKKIDVVGYKSPLVWIVEVKPFAGSLALGQLQTYKILYERIYRVGASLRLAIITNKCQNGYEEIFRLHNIQVFEVGICSQCAHYPAI